MQSSAVFRLPGTAFTFCVTRHHLGAFDEEGIIYIHKIDADYGLQMQSRIGGRKPLHSTAIGLSISFPTMRCGADTKAHYIELLKQSGLAISARLGYREATAPEPVALEQT